MSSSILKKQIQNIGEPALGSETGTVLTVGDGIARIHGLSRVMAGELIELTGQGGETIAGQALHLERDSVVAALFGDAGTIRAGDTVKRTGRLVEVPVGEACLGRVVNALGNPIDGKGPIETQHRGRVEMKGPGIVRRQPVMEPLQTGIKAIDAFLPIGRGQRELVLGDRRTGKTTVAVDTILNQKGKGVFCIYVAIGQSLSAVRQFVDRLEAHGAMEHTTVVAAGASEAALLQYLAPYTGATMGEHFRDSGRHALCVYDDLSKHAVAYRQISLLLGHQPGREMYPADVSYLHSRLLERAARMADIFYVVKNGTEVRGGDLTYRGVDGKAHLGALGMHNARKSVYELLDSGLAQELLDADKAGKRDEVKRLGQQLEDRFKASDYTIVKEPHSGGSLSALPIIETQAGDLSAFIPASILSITDGQIVLASDLFSSGVRPAIHLGMSVSHGRGTQIKAMKQIVSPKGLFELPHQAIAELAWLAPCFDARTRAYFDRSARLVDILKQDPYAPLPVEEQILILFACRQGLLDDLPVSELHRFEEQLFLFMRGERAAGLADMLTKKGLDDDTQARLRVAIEAFKKRFVHESRDAQ